MFTPKAGDKPSSDVTTASTGIVTSRLQHFPCKWSLHNPALLPRWENPPISHSNSSFQITSLISLLNTPHPFISGYLYTGSRSPLDTHNSLYRPALKSLLIFCLSPHQRLESLLQAFSIGANRTHPLPVCKRGF